MTLPRIAIAAAVLLLTGEVYAQAPGFGRPRNPTLSPYLNLLNRSNSTEFNYYQLYRPQTEFRSAYQGLNQSLYQTDTQVARQGGIDRADRRSVAARLVATDDGARHIVFESWAILLDKPRGFIRHGSMI